MTAPREPGSASRPTHASAPKPDASAESTATLTARGLHALRNEINVALMSVAVSRDLLGADAPEQVLAHLQRAEAACHRCGELLRDVDSRTH